MNYYFRTLWYELDRFATNDPMVAYSIAGIIVVGVGILCLRGNVIKR